MTLHSTREAVRLSGATLRQLDYWDRFGIVSPTVPAAGSGSRRKWSDSDIHTLAVVGRVASAVGRDSLHDVLVAAARAAKDHDRFDDVWIDLGNGVSLVVEANGLAVAL